MAGVGVPLTRPHAALADPTLARDRSVINVIVPEGRAHFFQQLGYVLATLLLFLLLLITVLLAARQRRRGGECGREAGRPASLCTGWGVRAGGAGERAGCPRHASPSPGYDYSNQKPGKSKG